LLACERLEALLSVALAGGVVYAGSEPTSDEEVTAA
jgi:hypothetical protein